MVMSTLLEADAVFARFALDREYGFVTGLHRAELRLPATFEVWEQLAADLMALSTSGKLRQIVNDMPVLDATPLLDDRLALERAHMLLSFVAHCYVRGRIIDSSLDRLPQSIAMPWMQVSHALGLLPIITYSGTVLFNFRLLDSSKPLTLDNVWTIITASGSIDESWFYLVALAIEAHSGFLLRLFVDLRNAGVQKDYVAMERLFHVLARRIGEMRSILLRMYEENIPAVFYQRVRRYLGGWLNDETLPNGLIYEPETVGRRHAGGSAAQSPIMQALDIVLGVRHARKPDHEDTGVPSSAGAYLIEMRNYMTREQRECLSWLEENINLHAMVREAGVPPAVREAFNECVAQLRLTRDKHIGIVSTYIIAQAQKTEHKTKVQGTGGSNPIPFLKEVRSHMDTVHITSLPKDT